MTEAKRCTKCGSLRPLSAFAEDRRTSDGRFRWCRDCKSEYDAERYSLNAERLLAKQEDFRRTLPGFLRHMLTGKKRIADRLGVKYDLSTTFLIELWERQGGLCAVSGIPLEREVGYIHETRYRHDLNASLDRINPDLGYTRDNVRLVCWFINEWKSNRYDWHFRDLLTKTIQGVARQIVARAGG